MDVESYTEVPELWELAGDVDAGEVEGSCPSATDTSQVAEVLEAMHDQEAGAEAIELEPDIMHADLDSWATEDMDHVAFIDDALREFGGDIGFYGAIARGQVNQLVAIAFEVEAHLKQLQGEIEEDIEEREEEEEEGEE